MSYLHLVSRALSSAARNRGGFLPRRLVITRSLFVGFRQENKFEVSHNEPLFCV